MGDLRRLGLVVTGGTVGSQQARGYGLTGEAGGEEALIRFSHRDGASLDLRARVPFRKHSENVTPEDWVSVAAAVRELVATDVDAVVVMHGTDTAGYSAAALTFYLPDLRMPVVVTGANQPPDAEGSDAATNLTHALTVAAEMPPAVYLSFAGVAGGVSSVFLGWDVRKTAAEGASFMSPNAGPVAQVSGDGLKRLAEVVPLAVPPSGLAVESRVYRLVLHPGIDLDMMYDALASTGKRGVAVELYPCASGPDGGSASLPRFISRCQQAGITVVTSIPTYHSNIAAYPTVRAIQDTGATFLDHIPETAFVKLCWALGQGLDHGGTSELLANTPAG